MMNDRGFLSRLVASSIARLESKPIGNGLGDTFFVRYKVFTSQFFSVYLHEFYRSDRDRCLHDHPWPFLSVILRGGYFEHSQDGVRWCRPGSILFRRATWAHRIELKNEKYWIEGYKRVRPWSLVIIGRKSRDWGFFTRDGWVKQDKDSPSPICE